VHRLTRDRIKGECSQKCYLSWIDETLAESVVRLWHVGQRLDQDLHTNVRLESSRNELIQFQDCQIGFEIVKVFLQLKNHVIFQFLQVVWVVSTVIHRTSRVEQLVNKQLNLINVTIG
jgi:hypothetical protein